ncbi:protocadherin-like wing polarity protein stan [Biomphalaria pfeifferi]|uniref:Protocadherin-like wing polarity protein stan n=1 Tax=Biomphalaria pfeifferi TaxID=112525 RepID=A0AAD8AXB9_BIOPF|nr:protocadherin-like wing polarity protein stan [Biomphalaria pfeifferi]
MFAPQITVFASDDQPSPRTDVAYVTVYVIRNPNPPVFSQALWSVRISEYQQVNVPLLTLAASDKDPPNSDSGKITFSVINQTAISPTSANAYKTDYFTVGSNNGQIYLARALTTLESADEYDIYIKAQDGAVTPRSDVARANIKIVRNMYRPVFEGTNFTTAISETQDINTYILNATAVDNDTLVDLNKGTPNAEVVYELRDFLVSDRQSRYFGVTETGMIYKKQATTGDSGRETFSFQVLARDNNWKRDLLSVSNVSITVNYVGSANGQLGFLQPIFLLEIQENVGISDAHPVLFMDVENQENNEVVCSISGGSDTFTVRAVDGQKNCALFLTSPLDVVRRDRYDLTVEVESKALTETGRRRRQTSFKYNSWGTARVVIDVNDVNNNAPQWVYVPYPRDTIDAPDGTRGIFITAVDYSSPPDTVAMQFKAIDFDLGLNGEVRYSLDVPTTSPPPFQIDVLNGNLITKDFPSLDRTSRTLPYQLTVKAYDLSVEPLGFKSTTAECFVNLIRDENRFVLVIKKSYTEVVTQKETYRQALQNSSSLVILLERIEPKRYIFNGALKIDLKATDVTFVAALPKTTYQLLTYNDPQADSLLTSMGAVSKIRSEVGSSLSSNIEAIRQSYGSNVIIKPMLIKSYIWWMDDPWAALIALASIIMLLSVVGIVVISFSYARYRNYVLKYRHQMEKSVVLDKQDNYEVQSLHMYVPQDDSAPPYDDLNMNSNSSEVGKISNNKYISTIDTPSWPPALRTNLQHDKLTMF